MWMDSRIFVWLLCAGSLAVLVRIGSGVPHGHGHATAGAGYHETEHRCYGNQFHCENSHQCKPQNVRCNGINDCGDWSDEGNCHLDQHHHHHHGDGHHETEHTCYGNQFHCANHKCIPGNAVCDGVYDCKQHGDNDQSDETNCQ